MLLYLKIALVCGLLSGVYAFVHEFRANSFRARNQPERIVFALFHAMLGGFIGLTTLGFAVLVVGFILVF